jgi:hypothetical protein
MNPVAEARRQSGVSRSDFAMAIGVSYHELFRAEQGYTKTLNARIARFLEENSLLEDPARQYDEWRARQGKRAAELAGVCS